jgi:hypothetical protein
MNIIQKELGKKPKTQSLLPPLLFKNPLSVATDKSNTPKNRKSPHFIMVINEQKNINQNTKNHPKKLQYTHLLNRRS